MTDTVDNVPSESVRFLTFFSKNTRGEEVLIKVSLGTLNKWFVKT